MIGKRLISYIDESEDILSLQGAKDSHNIIRTDQDADILDKIDEAIDWCSTKLGFSLRRAYADYYYGQQITGFTRLYNEEYSGTFLKIPANVLSVEAVYYRNDSDTETTLSTSDYEFVNVGCHIPYVKIINAPSVSDSGYAYRIRVIEGYYTSENGSTGDALDVLPYQIRTAIKLRFAALYTNRTDVNIVQTFKLTEGAESSLVPFMKLQVL